MKNRRNLMAKKSFQNCPLIEAFFPNGIEYLFHVGDGESFLIGNYRSVKPSPSLLPPSSVASSSPFNNLFSTFGSELLSLSLFL
jgi:hypothetical protein